MFNIKKFTLQLIFLLLSVLIISCEQQVILPKVCDSPPNLKFSTVIINVETTDTTSVNYVNVDKFGVINCNNFYIKQSNIIRNAKLGGTICGDGNININILYNDVPNDSKLQLQGHYSTDSVLCNFYYSPNLTGTSFTNIGFIRVNTVSGFGIFSTPLFSGEVNCSLR